MAANRLADERSAYLRSAAHQPIHWYAWGPEAFAAARAAERPILLDIGAVWCHWCHVMDGESYENSATAQILNENFVCVKVDRDERPDVDARYQRAVQMLTHQGGWPLTAFLTPDGQVFYGGTYFPPEDAYGRPGFRTVLASVLEAWRARRGQVESQARAVGDVLGRHLDDGLAGELSPRLLEGAADLMLGAYDAAHGGFGTQPKFPHPRAIEFLLGRWWDAADGGPAARRLREAVVGTLDGMAAGGIRDHLGGGFHRYSVDAEWIVPHFEKMSYDNSELLIAYSDACAALGVEAYADVARGIVHWVREVMADPDGGYAASQDADVGLDDDGDYFTWTRDEAAAVLAPAEFEMAAAYYDIGTAGEMHHDPAKNVLHVPATLSAVAVRLGVAPDAAAQLLASADAKLRAARALRTAPFVDRTRYTNWNAMMASAMLRAGAVLDEEWAHAHAIATLERIRREAPEPDAVAHTPGGLGGLLDDQVQAAAAALDAYEATGDLAWLEWAERLMDRVWRDYRDPKGGGFFDRARAPEVGEGLLPAAIKPVEDTPTPSANGVAAAVSVRLHELTGDARWRERAGEVLRAFAGRAAELGLHGATYLLALDRYLGAPNEFVVTGAARDPLAARMYRTALAAYAPRRVVRRLTPDDVGRSTLPPALAGMLARGPAAAAYACRGTACSPPAVDEAAWQAELRARAPAATLESS
ncbi:MAG TPA: thioredoxin domain-containing protein [Gemmatimonadales bacterium]|nr:thioredoxin domain-containing protein [Gemmatimonadales bacterium]